MANTAHTSQADLNKSHRSFLLPVDQDNSSLTQLVKTYLPKREIDKVWEAYRFSEKAHSGQKRRSGEAYISHPVSVACIAARFHLDSQSIQAALLHDVVEDTDSTELEIESKFGKQVSTLVTGLSKLDKVEFQDANEAQAENFRKMLLAMTQDVRVMLIKLSDRLHNMQTIQSLDERKKIRIAQETVDIYAPIANRLGLNNLYQELEDLCFEVLHPVRYKTIQKAIKASRGNRKEVIEKISNEISNKLKSVKTKA